MDKKIMIIVVLSIILIGIAGVYALNIVTENAYKIGFQDATLQINNQIINNLAQNGYITFHFPYQNQTIPIKLAPIEQ